MAAPNPASFDIARAGDFADRVVLYRHDLNFGNEGVPPDPHPFMTSANAVATAGEFQRRPFGPPGHR